MIVRKFKLLYTIFSERIHLIPNLLRIVWRKWKVKTGYGDQANILPPYRIILRLTNKCNLRCIQCGQWRLRKLHNDAKKDSFSSELSTLQWKKVISQISQKSFFCPHIHFFGGEPFIRKDLLELIKFASLSNIITGVNTNGTLLEGKAKQIIDSGLDYIIISLDGPERINNNIRVGEGNVFEKVIKGINELVSGKKQLKTHFPVITICFTLTKENQNVIVETAKIVKDFGADLFLVQLGIFTTQELGQISSEIIKKEFGCEAHYWKGFVSDKSKMDSKNIEKQIKVTKQLLAEQYNQLPPLQFDTTNYFSKPEMVLANKKCLVGWLTTHIMPNGDVSTCDDFPDIITGNILNDELKDIWENQTYNHFRKIMKEKGTLPFCSRCCSLYECDVY